jgi:hypothetical protein
MRDVSDTVLGALIAAMGTIVGAVLGPVLARPKPDSKGERTATGQRAKWLFLGAGIGFVVALCIFAVWVASSDGGAARLSIVSPGMNQTVPRGEIEVRGTWSNIDEHDAPRLIVYSPDIRRFYPDAEPIDQDNDGNWSARVVVGVADDVGKMFDLIAITSDASAKKSIEQYLAEGARTGDYPGLKQLPAGATRQDTVTVVRE